MAAGKRVWKWLARGLMGLSLALLSLLVLVLVALQLPWVRSRLARELSRRISEPIAGTVSIVDLGHIGLGSVHGVAAELLDASGRRVATLSGGSAALDLWVLVRTWISDEPLTLAFERVAAARLEVLFIEDAGGELSILGAFEPERSAPERDPSSPAEPLYLDFETVAIGQATLSYPAGLGDDGALEVQLSELIGSARRAHGDLQFELRQLGIHARGVPVVDELQGDLSAAGGLELDGSSDGPALDLRAQLSGTADELPFDARVLYSEGRVEGFVDVEASPPSLRQLWPDAAVARPVHLFVGFQGSLDRLQLLSVLESSGGNAYVMGHVSLAAPLSGELSILALGVDLGNWLDAAPETSIDVAAALRFTRRDGTAAARTALRTWDSRWEGRPLPDLALSAQLENGALTGSLRTDVPGARVLVRAELPLEASDDGRRRMKASLDVTIDDLARVAHELRAGDLGGSGYVRATLNLELGPSPEIVDATMNAALSQLATSEVNIDSVNLTASARGPLRDPEVELSVDARRVGIPAYPLTRVTVRARGGFDEARVSARVLPSKAAPIHLSASIFPEDATARQVELVMRGDADREAVRGSAERIILGPAGVDVRRLSIVGPGRVELDALSTRGGRIRAQGRTLGFSAAELVRRLGIAARIPSGLADVKLDVDYRPGHVSGNLQGSITQVRLGGADGRFDVAVQVEDNVIDGDVSACFPSLWDVELRASSLALPLPLDMRRISRLSGDLELVGRADVEQLRALPLFRETPLPSAGQLHAHVRVKGKPGAFPEITAALATHDLAWPRAGGVELAKTRAPHAASAWQELDVELVAEVTGARATLAAVLLDAAGQSLAELRARTRLDVPRLLARASVLQLRELRELPIQVELSVPERELGALPLPSAVAGIGGVLGANISATGTLGRPTIAAHLTLTGLKLDADHAAMPLAISASAELEGTRLAATALVRDERRKLLSFDAAARVSGGGAPPALEELDLAVRSNGLPLEPIGALVGLDVAGELYGSLRLDRLGIAPSAQGTLWINDLELDGFRQEQARWTVEAGADSFQTELTLEQAGGRALLAAAGPLGWRDALMPTLRLEATRVSILADNFQLRALRPLLTEDVRALSGGVDANITIDPGAERTEGQLSLRGGVVHVAALGQEFRDIRLKAHMLPSGLLQVTELRGRALRGRLSATGQARFEGLRFASAELQAQIPRGDPLPFTLEGVTMADAWGRFDVRARLDADAQPPRLSIEVDVPRLQVDLPRQTPHDVQELEEDPTVVTGTYRAAEDFVSLPLPPYEAAETGAETDSEPLVTRVEVRLGDRTWIERGTQLEVKIAGTVVLEVREEVTARGQVRIERGTIEVQGKIFELERGVITFVEDREPSNPTVVATARHTAPEGTEIYAEFVGPVETGKLTLRSEPPLRDDQILSLLLFGTPDGNFGTSTGDGTVGGAALAAGGSLVTRGLNQELRRLTSFDVQTRIGEHQGEPRPEVIVQISPRLTAELAYTLSAPTPARAQERTYLTLDLRLFRNWSLSTTIGDAGSLLLELLWRFRY